MPSPSIGIVPIKTKRDYSRTLEEIEGLMTTKRNTPEGNSLEVCGKFTSVSVNCH